jgi:hypothetical protein
MGIGREQHTYGDKKLEISVAIRRAGRWGGIIPKNEGLHKYSKCII